jgi:hypothetical protein
MKNNVRLGRALWVPSLCAGAILAGCSGSSSSSGGGGSSTGSGTFTLATVSVDSGQTWQINRAISFTFTQPVDFDTVNLNTISIQEVGGAPAVGDFYLSPTDPRTVFFQPVCPSEGDFSDAGFKPGGVTYQLNVPSSSSGATTVRSTSDRALELGSTRTFKTPVSNQLNELFLDTVPGPPSPLLRPISSTGCYVEVGGDPDDRQYFEVDLTGSGSLPTGYRVPINLYSDVSTRVAVVLEFNQAVSPTAENIDPSRLQLQYKLTTGQWTRVTAEVDLVANCTESGATVRLTPVGVLPQGRELRVVISPQFEDLVGDRNIVQVDDFANMDSDFASFDGVTPVATADQFLEEFVNKDFEDRDSALDAPRADWGPAGLKASFAFDGTGGPGGEFDFHIPPNTDFVFDTNSTLIFGGPGGVPQFSQLAINGRMDVRNLFIPATSSMRIQGPNPAMILASGTVTIDGRLSVNGSNAAQVFTLNTPYQPEPGAAGQGGGGDGGTASFLTNQVTPRGENGYGAFNSPNGGGEGGEGGWSPTSTSTNRRAAGGGGGVFGHDMPANTPGAFCVDQTIYGLDAESGFTGGPNSFSTQDTSRQPPWGGHVGPSPFTDIGGTDDDFLGTKRKDFGTTGETLVTGELLSAHAGAGGGAGGDATRVPSGSYPPADLIPADSDKGCGGGGGAGALTILALGDITVGSTGSITAIGGHGSGGENTSGTNRIGGGSGGGSGGHLILQTAAQIDLSAVPTGFKAIDARGGEGGVGADNNGGADENEQVQVRRDAKHDGTPGADNPWIPELDAICVAYTNSLVTGQTWIVRGAGGDGGPGVIQMHVGNLSGADSTHDIKYPGAGFASNLGNVVQPYPHGYDGILRKWVDQLLPVFGRVSKAQTSWIPLGGVTVAPNGSSTDPLAFLFDGTDTGTGLVQSSGGVVTPLAPILAPGTPIEGAGLPDITGARTIRMDASALPDDIYRLNPSLLNLFGLKIGTSSYTVASAEYSTEGANQYLDLTVQSTDPVLDPNTTVGLVELIPRYFRVVTSGTQDSLPNSTSIQIEFQATGENAQGNPDEAGASAWVTDISALDTTAGSSTVRRFLRYRVSFDIAVGGAPLNSSTPRPTLEFLRMPFKF